MVGLMGAAGGMAAWRLVSADATSPASRIALKDPGSAINVAVLISDGATIIDFCGPWEVFQDAVVPGPMRRMAFNLYTVAQTAEPITASAGMRIVPNFTFADAPQPRVVVIPAQGGRSDETLDWIRKSHARADLTMSVCTGAFLLAKTGLLKGLDATTHHDFYEDFAARYPEVALQRGTRFVWNEKERLASAGGLTSGIDMALRVVASYFGEAAAQATADYMEYQGRGWVS